MAYERPRYSAATESRARRLREIRAVEPVTRQFRLFGASLVLAGIGLVAGIAPHEKAQAAAVTDVLGAVAVFAGLVETSLTSLQLARNAREAVGLAAALPPDLATEVMSPSEPPVAGDQPPQLTPEA